MKYSKIAMFLIVQIICSATSYALPDLFSNITQNQTIKGFLTNIYENRVGKSLMDKIAELYTTVKKQKNGLSFSFSENAESTQFLYTPEYSKLQIYINPEHIKDGNIINLQGVSSKSYDAKRYVQNKVPANLEIVLVHELIHMKHCLEELALDDMLDKGDFPIYHKIKKIIPNIEQLNNEQLTQRVNNEQLTQLADKEKNYIIAENRKAFIEDKVKRLKYSFACGTGISSLAILKLHLEETSDNNRFSLWESLEERRTVCGPDIDNISENSYRLSKKLPIRYIYQQEDVNFFEPEEIILKVVSAINGSDKVKYKNGNKLSKNYTVASCKNYQPAEE